MIESVYLAYPIDQAYPLPASLAFVYQRIEESKSLLLDHGVSWVYDPGDAFTVAEKATLGPGIGRVNRVALEAAAGVLAWLPKGVGSIGVPMEIQHAASLGKPVAVVTDHRSWSLSGVDVRVFRENDADEAVVWLANQQHNREATVNRAVNFQVEPGGKLPTRAYEDDAGYDLYVLDDTTIGPGEGRDVALGVRVELPVGTHGRLVGRSSTLRKRGLIVSEGIIDHGYRGPLFAYCFNPYTHSTLLVKDERIAQLILAPNLNQLYTPFAVEALNPSARGEKGFGSSGL